MSRTLLVAAVCSMILASSAAHASVQLTQADLLGMAAIPTAGFSGSGILTANPTYGDLQPGMTGDAGATGELNPFVGGAGVTVYYALNAVDLAAFNASLNAGDTFALTGHNDNNQNWALGIWYETAAGIVEDFATLAAGTSGGLSLANLPDTVLGAGVAVRNTIGFADVFHASFSVPEASTIAVWSVLSMAGLGVAYKKRRAN